MPTLVEPKPNSLAPQLQCTANFGCAQLILAVHSYFKLCIVAHMKKKKLFYSCVYIVLYYYSRVHIAYSCVHTIAHM